MLVCDIGSVKVIAESTNPCRGFITVRTTSGFTCTKHKKIHLLFSYNDFIYNISRRSCPVTGLISTSLLLLT